MSRGYVSGLFLAAALTVATSVGVSAVETKEAKAAHAATPTCGGGTMALTTAEEQLVASHNDYRASKGLAKLCVSPILTKAARAHSQEMINRDYFRHPSANGESSSSRLKRFGYTPLPSRPWTVGENIGRGHSTSAMLTAWKNSSGHNANMLGANFREIGVGVRVGDWNGRVQPLYTVDFGNR